MLVPTIYFATSTGKTEDVAHRLAPLVKAAAVLDVAEISDTADLGNCEALICCTPTWNTGADDLRSGTAWDSHVEAIETMPLQSKPVAIMGLGDSSSYGDYFCDAMEELYRAFERAGARLVGQVDISGYNYNRSRSVLNGRFCGLPIDEDSEPELTEERLQRWAEQLRRELV
ncbi:MAG: flavodoxin FldA [Cyanobacteria bacterium J06638_7]